MLRGQPFCITYFFTFIFVDFYISIDYDAKKYIISKIIYLIILLDIYVPSNHDGVVICGSVKLFGIGELFEKTYVVFLNGLNRLKIIRGLNLIPFLIISQCKNNLRIE